MPAFWCLGTRRFPKATADPDCHNKGRYADATVALAATVMQKVLLAIRKLLWLCYPLGVHTWQQISEAYCCNRCADGRSSLTACSDYPVASLLLCSSCWPRDRGSCVRHLTQCTAHTHIFTGRMTAVHCKVCLSQK